MSDSHVDFLVRQTNTNLSQQLINGDPTFGSVLVHLRIAFIRARMIRKSGYFASVLELCPVWRCHELSDGGDGVYLPDRTSITNDDWVAAR